ncbi:DNA primase [Candidatus Babeliales bacterium]|nr:DNA primase [Candidatus Babeliales bacterium]
MTVFDYVKTSVPILDVVGSYVSLKRLGGYYKGPCPLHSEKDASFTVSPDRNIFYCFGCQVGGDVISFIARVERLSQGQALKHLIEQHSLVIPEALQKEMSKHSDSHVKESLTSVAKSCAKWAHKNFLNNEYAEKYLLSRGMNKKMMQYFEVGFVSGGTAGMQRLIKGMHVENILLNDLKSIGFVMDGKGKPYSPFEDRILFPIKDSIGRYIAFSGRVFLPQDERARYYNSKESEMFSKRQTLFGFDLARKKAQQTNTVFLVEGGMDVVAMVQDGYENSVATLGTACSVEHLQSLRRFVHTLVVVYDGDKAGQNAIEKVAELCWDIALTLKVVSLPEGEDPASLLQKGISLKTFIDQQEDIFTFLIKKTSKDFFNQSMTEKLRLCTKVVRMVNHAVHGLKRHLLLQQVSGALQIPLTMLQKISHQELRQQADASIKEKQKVSSLERSSSNESSPVKIEIVDSIEEKITSFFFTTDRQSEEYLKAYMHMHEYWNSSAQKIVEQWFQSPIADIHCFLDSLLEADRQWILSIVMKYSDGISYEVVKTLMNELKKRKWKAEVNKLKHDLDCARHEGDTEKVHSLMNNFLILKQKIRN